MQFSMHSTLLRAQMKDTQGSRPAGQFPGCALQQVSVSPLQNGLFSESSAKRGPEKAKATFEDIIKKYPDSKAAAEAKKLLGKIAK